MAFSRIVGIDWVKGVWKTSMYDKTHGSQGKKANVFVQEEEENLMSESLAVFTFEFVCNIYLCS